jgi:hypothetical protein
VNNSSAGLIETRHALPKSERETVQAVLAKVLNHMSRSDRPLRESYDIMMDETPTADGVTFSAVDQREVRGWWVRAQSRLSIGRSSTCMVAGSIWALLGRIVVL